jgi:hypothetical protein
VQIDNNNCPERLKQVLFEFNEILEGNGEKIMEDVKNRSNTVDVDAPGYAERLNKLFSSVQIPLVKGREQEKLLSDKRGNEVDIDRKFDVGDSKQGKSVIDRISGSIVNCRGDFHFFPQKEEQSDVQKLNNFRQLTNSEIIQDVKNHPQN